MPVNYVLQGLESLTLTSTSVTLGYLPGNTPPPEVLILWPASTATVTLPPINTILPNFTTITNYNPGNNGIILRIKSLTGQVVNISGASATDKIFDTLVISSSGARVTLLASVTDNTWYQI